MLLRENHVVEWKACRAKNGNDIYYCLKGHIAACRYKDYVTMHLHERGTLRRWLVQLHYARLNAARLIALARLVVRTFSQISGGNTAVNSSELQPLRPLRAGILVGNPRDQL